MPAPATRPVRNVAASGLGGTTLKIENSRSPYVLPGATRSWEIVFPKPPATGTQLRLTAETRDGAIDQVVTFDPAAP